MFNIVTGWPGGQWNDGPLVLKMLTDDEIAKWNQFRATGVVRFVLRCGVLGWGLWVWLLMSPALAIVNGGVSDIGRAYVIGLIPCLIGGIVWGYLMWLIFLCIGSWRVARDARQRRSGGTN